MKRLSIVLLLVGAFMQAHPYAANAAPVIIPVVENFTVSDLTELPAIDVRRFSEISILGLANAAPAQVFVVFLSEAAGGLSATTKIAVGACNVPIAGVTGIGGCFRTSGEFVETFKVAGPFLGLVLATGGETRTFTLKLSAK